MSRVARSVFAVAFAVLFILSLSSYGASARELSFEERVDAQRAIEGVYWLHRTWPGENTQPKPRLSESMPESALRAKVSTYLEQSSALERIWGWPITGQQLQAEIARMSRDTKQPEILAELYRALDDDPLRIAECLARPALADRLVRSAYASDDRIHESVRRAAEEGASRYGSVAELKGKTGTYSEATWRLMGSNPQARSESAHPGAMDVDAEQWDALLARTRSALELAGGALPTPAGSNPSGSAELPFGRRSRLIEGEEAFSVVEVLSRTDGTLKIATVTWPKVSFEAWWAGKRGNFSIEIAVPDARYSVDAVELAACTDNTWTPMLTGGPDPRQTPTGVWTGTEMIVWGGWNGSYVNTGARYNPATDTWTATTLTGAPTGRWGQGGVWTGTEMIVWGGYTGTSYLGSGGRYNPATDTWVATTTTSAPVGRYWDVLPSAVWSGTEMIVWGGWNGSVLNTGGRYRPSTNTWTATATTGAPPARVWHTAVWSGTVMIVWGGTADFATGFNNGGRYDPASNTWTATSTGANVPAGRWLSAAVWTGSEMVVWSGYDGTTHSSTGGRYDPSTNSWTATSVTGAPAGRERHTAVWTGTEMVAWGGHDGTAYVSTGGRYTPATDTWSATSIGANVPAPRESPAAVWTGSEMIVWGGLSLYSFPARGGRYDPVSDTWTATSTGPAAVPHARAFHKAVWSGVEMIVWGGQDGTYLNTGLRYVPATDAWTATSVGANVPSARVYHSAIWDGSRMVVWGGFDDASYFNTGGRYDPSTDSWLPTSVAGSVPSPRGIHSVVWSGSEMIVWGGWDGSSVFGTGGRYDPSTDTWTATSTTGAPAAREYASAVWTGTRMVIWGGDASSVALNSGGRYDPSTDTWSATTTTGAPTVRRLHAVVWTGSEMIVWGGSGFSGPVLSTGGRYNPVSDAWTATAVIGVPAARDEHTAVWTGGQMVVWGGYGASNSFNTGSRYNPATNLWNAITTTGAPAARYFHTALWSGSQMIVWGVTATGGLYCASSPCTVQTWYRDADSDTYGNSSDNVLACVQPTGYIADGTDCNDANGAVNPGATEACNGIDDDCDTQIDEGLLTTFYLDADGDLFGDAAVSTEACTQPTGYTTDNTDCNDADGAVNPGATEACNGIDDDCDTQIDEGLLTTFYLDADGDLFGDAAVSTEACTQPTGYTTDNTDCNDADGDAWGTPGEVTAVVFAADHMTMSWTPPATGGTAAGMLYDVLRSDVASDFVTTAICIESDDGPNTTAAVPANPIAGAPYFYLHRAQNSCPSGVGTLGQDSLGNERVGRTCP